jgi:hypothetical protein
MFPQSSLEIVDPGLIGTQIVCRRQQLQPDRVEFQSTQSEHPLQGYRKIATALAVLRRKTTSKKDGHALRIARVATRSSPGVI